MTMTTRNFANVENFNVELRNRGLDIIQPVLDIFAATKDVSDIHLTARFAKYMSELSKQVPADQYCKFINGIYNYGGFVDMTLPQEFFRDFVYLCATNPENNLQKNVQEYVFEFDNFEKTVSNFVYEFILFFCDSLIPSYSDFERCLKEYHNNTDNN